MLLKCCTQYANKVKKLSSGHRTGKDQYSFQSKERQCQRMLELLHIALISHASKVMLKILQAKVQQYVNHELPDIQADLEKTEEPEIIANIRWIIKKAREFQKKHLLLLY